MNTEQWGNIELPGLSDEELHAKNWNFAKTKSDKQRRSRTVKQVAAQRDEEYRQKLHQGIANRDNTYQAEVNARPEVQAKISKSLKGRQKSAEHIARVAEKSRQRGIPCITPFGVFRTGADAGHAYNQQRGSTNGKNAVNKALKTGRDGYRYITIEEYTRLTGLDS